MYIVYVHRLSILKLPLKQQQQRQQNHQTYISESEQYLA